MTSPLPLPDWVPWWVHLVLLMAALLFGLLFLLMPFSVFGVKARLEGVEARLDEIQGEIRSLALRLPELVEDDGYASPKGMTGGMMAGERVRSGDRPPIPPAPVRPEAGRAEVGRAEVGRAEVGRAPRAAGRAEPRLY